MNFVGIITEYDPFHNGHAAQLAMLRERGVNADAVCMSAGAVQRGGIPLLPEPVRVRAALQAGADLLCRPAQLLFYLGLTCAKQPQRQDVALLVHAFTSLLS